MDAGWGDVADGLLSHAAAPVPCKGVRAEGRGRPKGPSKKFAKRAWEATATGVGDEPGDDSCAGVVMQHPGLPVHTQFFFAALVKAGGGILMPPFRHLGTPLQMQIHASALSFQHSEPAESLHQAFLCSERFVTSAQAEAGLRHYPRGRDLVRDVVRVASSTVEACGLYWGHALCAVRRAIESGFKPLVILKRRKYDETPLRIRLRSVKDSSKEKEKSVSKILQTLFSVRMLMRSPTGEYQILQGIVPTYLQALDKNSAENLMSAQLDLEDVIPEMAAVSKLFPLKIQHPVTDRCAANTRCELGIAAQDPTWVLAHQYCRSHKIAQVQTKAVSLAESNISGLLALALSMQQAGSTADMRKVLNDIWSDDLHVQRGPAPEHAKEFREEIYNLFLGTLPSDSSMDLKYKAASVRRRQQRFVLNHFLNGELRAPEISHWTLESEDSGYTRSHALFLFRTFVTPALIPGKCDLFPRSRWTGGDLAVDWAALLASHHNLLAKVVHRWVSQLAAPQAGPAAAAATTDAADATGWAQVASAGSMAMPALQNLDGPSEVQPDDLPHAQAAVDQQAKDEFDWAKFNQSMKNRARGWALSNPASELAIIRAVMVPTFRLLFANFKLYSEDWDEEQEMKFAETGSRTYRMVEEFRGTHLQTFWEGLQQLFFSRMRGIQIEDHNLAVRTLMYRMIARAGACAQRLLGASTRTYPGKLLSEGIFGSTERVFQDRPCLYDPVTAEIVGRYSTPRDLQSADAQAELHMLAAAFESDISGIEARHAGVRRVAVVQSCQTHGVALRKASAEFVCRSYSRRVPQLPVTSLLTGLLARRPRLLVVDFCSSQFIQGARYRPRTITNIIVSLPLPLPVSCH